MQKTFVSCAVLVAMMQAALAQTAVEKARLSRTMWSAFECSVYADLSGNEMEQARLFDLGVKSGREFIEAVNTRQIPPDMLRVEVNAATLDLLQGPSTDFMVGRVYESAATAALQKAAPKNADVHARRANGASFYTSTSCARVK